jgi:arylamine N-acetyltransferase
VIPIESSNLRTMAYTDQDIDEYLTRISFPSHKYPKPVKGLMSTQEGLEFLARLQKYQLVAVPYENLSLHYAKFPAVSLDKNDLFEKIVRQRRGGYCMELNLFFSTILQSLGYEVIHTGARVYNPSIGEFGGW